MTDIEELRARATHARRVADYVTDSHAKTALRAYADELECKAAELEGREAT